MVAYALSDEIPIPELLDEEAYVVRQMFRDSISGRYRGLKEGRHKERVFPYMDGKYHGIARSCNCLDCIVLIGCFTQ